MNFNETIEPVIIFINKEITKELFNRELEISGKSLLFPGINLGFYQESGKQAMHKRGMMSKFFQEENMTKIQP